MTHYLIPSPAVYGSMFNHDTPTEVTISAMNTPTQIGTGFTAGTNFKTIFQNSREIVLNSAGVFLISWQISFSGALANQEIEGGVMIDGVINTQSTAHRFISTATDTGSMSGSCELDLLNGQIASLAVTNETSTANIIIEHAQMIITRIDQ